MRKADEISLEELYQILHVSKRKATWMLEHGVIPCRKRETATHKYAIKLEDVLEYLKKDEKERNKDIPVGIFSSKNNKAKESACSPRLSQEEKEIFKKILQFELINLSDTPTVEETSKAIGYCRSTIYRLARSKRIYSAKIGSKTIVSKKSLIELIISEDGFSISPKSDWHKSMIELYKSQ
jgi:hypothetical protein